MPRRVTILILAATLLAALAAPAGAVVLNLEPTDDANAAPYHSLSVTVRNDSSAVIDGLQFQMKEGGPTFVQPVLIPAGQSETFTVALPALSPQQTYRVRTSTGKDSAAQETWATVSLPPGSVRAQDLVDPRLYADFEGVFAGWSGEFVREIFVGAVLLCLLLAATLLLRRPAVRIGAAVLIAAAAAIAAAAYVDRQPALLEKTIADANSPTVILVAARRTSSWRHRDGRLIPIYPDEQSLATDKTLIEGPLLDTTVTPQHIRLFVVR